MEVMKQTPQGTFSRRSRHTSLAACAAAFAVAIGLALTAAPVCAQVATSGRSTELGIDAAATFGLGDQSSIDFSLPGSRFRLGFFQPGSRVSIEPAAGLGYHKVEGVDGVFQYDLEL